MQTSQKPSEELVQALFSQYIDNMNFLQIYCPQTYEKVQQLSNMIDDGSFTPHFELELKDNSFDIINIQNNQYLYNQDLNDYSTNALKEIDYSLKGTINTIYQEYYSIDHPEKTFLLENDIVNQTLKNTIYDIINFKKIFDYPELNDYNKTFQNFNHFIFFGTLLGKHLMSIHNKLKCNTYLILEPNLEIFRLSLFVTDYRYLALDSRLFFSIMDDTEKTQEVIGNFLTYQPHNTYIIKYFSTNMHDKSLIDTVTNTVKSSDLFMYDYYRILHFIDKTVDHIKDFPTLQESNAINDIQDSPLLVLSPGPSLSKSSQWLQQNHDKFITVAFAATLNKLKTLNIKPDIIISLDSNNIVAKQFENNEDVYQDSLFILASDTSDKVISLLNKNNIFMVESITNLTKNGFRSGPKSTIGEFAMHSLLTLGFNQIYLLGTDLAVDDDGKLYDDSYYLPRNDHNISNRILNSSDENNYIEVEGNLAPKVFTTELFFKSLQNYYYIISSFKNQNQHIFNLSQGAKIFNTIPKNIDDTEILDFSIINKVSIKEKLKSFFYDRSLTNIETEDRNLINEELVLIDKIMKMITSKNLPTSDNLNNDKLIIEIFEAISMKNHFSILLNTILGNYFGIINKYINFNLNDRKINADIVQMSKKMKHEQAQQLLKILNSYKNSLQKLLN